MSGVCSYFEEEVALVEGVVLLAVEGGVLVKGAVQGVEAVLQAKVKAQVLPLRLRASA